MPVAGEILEFNPQVEQTPDIINKEPYDGGWIVKLRITNPADLDDMLDAETYKGIIA